MTFVVYLDGSLLPRQWNSLEELAESMPKLLALFAPPPQCRSLDIRLAEDKEAQPCQT